MGKLIGMDLGTKRTGIAITDDLQIIASPLETVPTSEIMAYLEKLMKNEDIEAIVLGEPKYLDGNSSAMTKNAHNFKMALEKKFPHIPVELEDEMFTSKMAMDSLKQSGAKKRKEETAPF